MTARVDAQELPLEQAQLVTKLMSDTSTPTAARTPAAGADRFSYELTIGEGARTRTFHWDETQVPDSVRPLLASLASRARPAPPT